MRVTKTNVLTKFHGEGTIKEVTYRVQTRINSSPPGGKVFQQTGTIFKLFHENWTINVTFRVLTSFYKSHMRKNAPPPWWPCSSTNGNNFQTLLTRFHYSHIWKNALPPGGLVFQHTRTIFELIQDINRTNVLSNVNKFAHLRGKTAPLHSSRVIKLTRTIFELNSGIKETNVLSKFHENWAKNVTYCKNAPPTGGHVFSPIPTIFKLVGDISKAMENCHYIHIEKNALPTGGNVFSPISTIFELVRDIN
ncbi:hypothetical protein DPMN_008203 [Dreissena polymorpha]|uniref:Uncharacterized protein n=1 Tax=Dreissena polymorpha TaxID=45954 RepID=A0A9D4MXM5_DREPO|nr:hypothetical protein DPMN_008203 [Dreissena polymorpha]